jgi:hypothetical protein
MDIIVDNIGRSDRDVILSIINSRFIIDYGTVETNNGDGTIDVIHAVPATPLYPPDGYVPENFPTRSKGVEVLFLSGVMFSSKFELQVGDPVLLLGLKDLVNSTKGITVKRATVFSHYSQNTLKAIPLAAPNSQALAQINIVNGLFQIKNTAQSLATILESLTTQGPPPFHFISSSTIAQLQGLLAP